MLFYAVCGCPSVRPSLVLGTSVAFQLSVDIHVLVFLHSVVFSSALIQRGLSLSAGLDCCPVIQSVLVEHRDISSLLCHICFRELSKDRSEI